MYIPFDELSESARIWIYQADRTFKDEEVDEIRNYTESFLEQWAAHGQALKSSSKMIHNKFLVIAVDEMYNKASGCSIDASVALVKELEMKLKVNFFDRTKVSFLLNGEIFQSSMTEVKDLISGGKISSETITFNNLVGNVGELNNQWQIPAGESWLKRYF